MLSIVAAQLVLLPVNLVQIWIYWNWPRGPRRRGRDALAVVIALGGWLIAAIVASHVDDPHSPIWGTVVGSTAGFLAFTSLLLGAWIIFYRHSTRA